MTELKKIIDDRPSIEQIADYVAKIEGTDRKQEVKDSHPVGNAIKAQELYEEWLTVFRIAQVIGKSLVGHEPLFGLHDTAAIGT